MFSLTAEHPLTSYGWDESVAQSYLPLAGPGLLPGRIARVDRGRVDAVVPDGDSVRTVPAGTALVATSDPMRVPCTGDWAVIDLADARSGSDTDGAGGTDGTVRTDSTGAVEGTVRRLLPRRTAFVRSTASNRSEGQVLAANVDTALVTVPLTGNLDLGRIERFVALAWTSGVQPVVVLTKADLVPDAGTLAQLVADTEAAAPGVHVTAVSAEHPGHGEGIDALTALVAGGTSVLLGASGAGKSTLANALTGKDVQDVQAVRDRDGKGRHTTTTRDLLPLGAASGGVLIDTPGLRGVGLWDAEEGVGQAFAEIEALAEECRFHDCAHESEPGCAVHAAIDDGTLPRRRLESYRKLLRENARIAARTDARLRAEQKRRVKQQQKALGRYMMERKRGPRRKP